MKKFKIKYIFLGIKSLIFVALKKIRYLNKIQMHLINSIRGKFYIMLTENSNLKIGNFLTVRGPVYIMGLYDSKIKIGDNVFFNHNVSITSMEGISIGNNCKIANNVVIVDHNHKKSNFKLMDSYIKEGYVSKSIIIEDDVWIGSNATIAPNAKIGKGATIAANSFVNKPVPPYEIWGGVPAKKISNLNEV